MNISLIKKWSSYFHDADLISVNHKNNNIEITMESSQVFHENLLEISSHIALTRDFRFRGILHLEGLRNITANDEPLSIFIQLFDTGEICDLIIQENIIELSVLWQNYPPKPRQNDFIIYKIETDKIYWENIPDS